MLLAYWGHHCPWLKSGMTANDIQVCLFWCSDLLENGGFVCALAHKVRKKGGGKGPAGVSAGLKSGLINALASPNPHARSITTAL